MDERGESQNAVVFGFQRKLLQGNHVILHLRKILNDGSNGRQCITGVQYRAWTNFSFID